MVAWAEEGDREKEQLGFPERLTPPDVVSTSGGKKKKESSKCFVLFCVMAELGVFNIDLYT